MGTSKHKFAERRGSTLLMATGVITLGTVAVFVSLAAVRSEGSVQGDERRGRIAFFAAEAGLSEGREKMRILVGADPTYTAALNALGSFTSEAGLPANQLLDVLPWTNYSLETSGAEISVDPTELEAPDGTAISLNTQRNVRYRVFTYDDDDGDGSVLADTNKLIWLVSVGEVASDIPGAMPVRSVIRSLIRTTAGVPTTPGYGAQKGQGSDKTFTSNDSNAIQFGSTTF